MRYFFVKMQNKEKKTVKSLLLLCFTLVILVGALVCIPTPADAEIYDNVIRFHVIANSDSEEDQALKLKVRDAVIERYHALLSGYSSKAEAEEEIEKHVEDIKNYAQEVILSQGYSYKCDAEISVEHYGRTVYESFSMPEGYYTSLRIIIGEGSGKNWWCVLFPPLCTKAAINETSLEDEKEEFIEVGFTGEQYNIITQTDKPKYKFKFRLLELFFGG